jgi:hypothetical protein
MTKGTAYYKALMRRFTKDPLSTMTDLAPHPRRTVKRGGKRFRRTFRKKGGKRPSKRVGVCFPGDSQIVLEDGRRVPISKIQVGDKVMGFTGDKSHTVVFVPHALNEETHLFHRLTLLGGGSLRLTELHYIPVRHAGEEKEVVIRAKDVVVGDLVETRSGGWIPVVAIETDIEAEGVYSFVVDGSPFITVDGVRVSPYGYDLFSHEVYDRLFDIFRLSFRVFPAFNKSQVVAKTWLSLEDALASMLGHTSD